MYAGRRQVLRLPPAPNVTGQHSAAVRRGHESAVVIAIAAEEYARQIPVIEIHENSTSKHKTECQINNECRIYNRTEYVTRITFTDAGTKTHNEQTDERHRFTEYRHKIATPAQTSANSHFSAPPTTMPLQTQQEAATAKHISRWLKYDISPPQKNTQQPH